MLLAIVGRFFYNLIEICLKPPIVVSTLFVSVHIKADYVLCMLIKELCWYASIYVILLPLLTWTIMPIVAYFFGGYILAI